MYIRHSTLVNWNVTLRVTFLTSFKKDNRLEKRLTHTKGVLEG